MLHTVFAAPFALALASALPAQSTIVQSAPAAQSTPSAQSKAAEQQALEIAFEDLMTGCQMVGHFTINGSKKPPRAETYTITKAEKVRGDRWKFAAKIEYDDKSVEVPLFVNVIWAGDTPTIQVTKMAIPMLGTYSARVAFYDEQYAGLWSGKDYGGHMYGKVVRAKAEAQDPAAKDAATQVTEAQVAETQGNPIQWASWRGPKGSGAATGNPPTSWSEDENIRWKVALPGLGNSTPIVWGDRIYVTTAVETEEAGDAPKLPPLAPRQQPAGAGGESSGRGGRGGRARGSRGGGGRQGPAPLTKVYDFRVMALDRLDGSVIWSKSVHSTVPHEPGHKTGSQASSSPVTDGEHIYAHFGSRGIHCLDMNGELVWSKDFGYMRTRNEFGEGSSPALWGDMVVVNWDHEGESFVCALNKKTGEEIWRTARDEITSWSTPVIVEVDGRPQVIITATGASRAYDLETGKSIWSCTGMTTNAIPTPIVRDGTAWLMSGFRGAMLQAIKLSGAKGDITDGDHVLWSHNRQTSYVPSALLYGDRIWFLRSSTGVLSCLNAKTGKMLYEGERLRGLKTVYASPVAAADRVYVTSREGTTKVIKADDAFEELATNQLDDVFDASAVIIGDQLYLRGHDFLYCIAKKS